MSKFEIIPAIDLLKGEAVRLTQGDYKQKTVYEKDPVKVAKRWEQEGAARIHVVDLDGAKAGRPVNTETIKKIVAAVSIPIQLGGGIRTIHDLNNCINLGIDRVILGSAIIQNADFVKTALKKHGSKIILGLDAKAGKLAITGWTDVTNEDVISLAQTMTFHGATRIIYTDISKDGMLHGPDLSFLLNLAAKTSMKIIASGGIANIEHITNIIKFNPGNIEGCIIGKALYNGMMSLPDVIKAVSRTKEK